MYKYLLFIYILFQIIGYRWARKPTDIVCNIWSNDILIFFLDENEYK